MIENFDKRTLTEAINKCYEKAEAAADEASLADNLSSEEQQVIKRCANTRHAARGAVVTLGICKIVYPEQDIRLHKADFDGGFSARGLDTAVTVPFLQSKGLPYNVETHWLSQTLSFAGPFMPDSILKTVPKSAGPDLVAVANIIQNADSEDKAESVVTLMLYHMIQERNKGNIQLTKPKNLSIDQVLYLLHKHFEYKYKKNAPRLPQVAVYAIYQCLKESVGRYSNFELLPLERLKTANRKSGSVGDIDLALNGRPIEAVEIKYEIPVSASIVAEAMQKIKSESVERYLILSTRPPLDSDIQKIEELKLKFLRSNGCEIIVNGVYETIKYYLRLLKSTNDFIVRYTDLLGQDPDLDYEHRTVWNMICE